MTSQGGAIWVGNCTASRTKKLLLALIDGSAYAQGNVAHQADIQEGRPHYDLFFRLLEDPT